jgi:hypothetical protein
MHNNFIEKGFYGEYILCFEKLAAVNKFDYFESFSL